MCNQFAQVVVLLLCQVKLVLSLEGALVTGGDQSQGNFSHGGKVVGVVEQDVICASG